MTRTQPQLRLSVAEAKAGSEPFQRPGAVGLGEWRGPGDSAGAARSGFLDLRCQPTWRVCGDATWGFSPPIEPGDSESGF